MSARPKRILAIGDMHCGHLVGLTPPQWQISDGHHAGKRHKFSLIQTEIWNWFCRQVDALQPIDIVFINGDSLDGKGARSGGCEQITTDMLEQCAMAQVCIDRIRAKHIVMTYGTTYHGTTESGELWEDVLATNVGADKIGTHEWISVNGVVFDLKHHIPVSQVPHTRATAVMRDRLWNALWAEHDEQPRADIILRSHAHYYIAVDSVDWLAMVLPPLQGMGSRYGSLRCSGHVDVGMVHFDVAKNGSRAWEKHIIKVRSQKAAALKL